MTTKLTPAGNKSRADYYKQRRANIKKEKQSANIPLPLERAANAALLAARPIGDVIGDWAESTLKVPFGPLIGQPFVIPEWQREWLSGALQPGIREAALSTARKNGKSGLIAALMLCFMHGPLFKEEWQSIVVSLNGKLAALMRDAIEKTAVISGLLVDVKRSPVPGHVLGPGGTRVEILASDRATGHATGADIALIDEAGLLTESSRPLWDAIYSSISGRDGRLMCISVRGDSPMFTELAERADQPQVYWKEYTAPVDAQLDDRLRVGGV